MPVLPREPRTRRHLESNGARTRRQPSLPTPAAATRSALAGAQFGSGASSRQGFMLARSIHIGAGLIDEETDAAAFVEQRPFAV